MNIMNDSAEEELEGFLYAQNMVNTGTAWHLEGAVGRQCMDLIGAGVIMLGAEGHRDYWGSYVPARVEVQPGTKGSYEFVAERSGEAWAKKLLNLKSPKGYA